ncbi:MAG: MOSC domain-containing protein [Acidimicrobiales bacterium]
MEPNHTPGRAGPTLTEDELTQLRNAPREQGTLELIVRRPSPGTREVLLQGMLTTTAGLAGDGWASRPSRRTPDGAPHIDMQLNIMGVRAASILAGPTSSRPMAGDQLFVDFDLSEAHLPAGTWLSIGDAAVVVTAQPHTGCPKFSTRFGADALRAVSTPVGRQLRLRGLCARVLRPGMVRVGDPVRIAGPSPTDTAGD